MRANPATVLRGDHNECPTCGQLFNSTHAFERHRTGDFGKNRQCRTVDDMSKIGMSKNSGGFWISSTRKDAICNSSCDSRIA